MQNPIDTDCSLKERQMSNEERSDAYYEALRNYTDASARTRCHVEAFTALLVAEKVLSAHVEFDPALTHYRDCCAP
jgi:hypothetical protein